MSPNGEKIEYPSLMSERDKSAGKSTRARGNRRTRKATIVPKILAHARVLLLADMRVDTTLHIIWSI